MKTLIFPIDLDYRFDLCRTVESHGWCQLAPWHWDGECLGRSVRVASKREWISVKQHSPYQLIIYSSSSNSVEVSRLVSRWLHLDWNPEEFLALCEKNDAAIADTVRSGGGRFLRGDTFFEDLIKTICTINTTWKQTQRMVSSLVSLGESLFPQPLEMLEIGPERLITECKLGFRANTVESVTTQLLQDKAIQIDGSDSGEFLDYNYLVSLRGIGPYSAAHAMMLLRDFSTIPVDSEVSAYLRQRNLDPRDAQDAFAHWGQYRFLGYKLKRIIDRNNWIGN